MLAADQRSTQHAEGSICQLRICKLQRLEMALGAGACLLVLGEALTGWDAMAAELREASGMAEEGKSDAETSTAAQAVVDALCALHNAGALR